MEKLGIWLCQAREAKGCTLEEAEESTRIRAHFLELLENGDFSALPGGDVQVRGFLRIYARFLDLPLDEVLARYNAEVHGQEPPETPPAATQSGSQIRQAEDALSVEFRPRDIPVSSALPRQMGAGTLLAVAIVLIILLAILVTVNYMMGREGAENPIGAATATAHSPPVSSSEATTTKAPSTTSPPSQATPTAPAGTATPTFPVNPDGEVTLTLEANEHVWVRVKRGSETIFEGILAPDQNKTWTAQAPIVVETGNGAGLQVTVNGQPQGTMCGRGEVCTRAWGPSGEVAPSGV